MPGSAAAHPDDVAGDDHWHGADGAEDGNRQRAVCTPGQGNHWRIDGLGCANGFHCAGGLPAGLRAAGQDQGECGAGGRTMRRDIPCALATVFLLAITLPCIMQAQITAGVSNAQNLPPAPTPSSAPAQTPQNQSVPMALPGTQMPSTTSANAEPTLTLAQAQAMATRNNPRISVARLVALAS